MFKQAVSKVWGNQVLVKDSKSDFRSLDQEFNYNLSFGVIVKLYCEYKLIESDNFEYWIVKKKKE